MRKPRFPEGWNESRVADLIAHYEGQSEEEAVAEDEAAMSGSGRTIMEVPTDLVPAVRDLIARRSGVGMSYNRPPIGCAPRTDQS